MADCCPVLTLALSREHEKDQAGIARAFGPGGSGLVIRFRKAPRVKGVKPGEYDHVAMAVCKFCPFCGKKREP